MKLTSSRMCQLLLIGLIIFGSIPICAFSQASYNVTGKVTDENGVALAGISVMIKGNNVGTSTDQSGIFDISVPTRNSVLTFSYVDYIKQEIAVNGKTNLNVQLTPDPKSKSLGEVVVIGYGTQRKVDLTGAVGSISRKDIVSRPLTSPDQALGGKIAGVVIANRSGDPAAPIDVRIRGIGTVGTNQPLWVIDGVPIVQTTNVTVNTASYTESNPLAGINPNDIESIDVLKDASASAIYGARAANGVIIITTKRGKEGKPSVVYDGYRGYQSIANNKKMDVLNVAQYITLQKELGRDFSSFQSLPYFDWQDAIFKTAKVDNHNLSVSGGTKTMNFNIGAGYHEQDGIEIAQRFKRLSIKANSDFRVGKYLKFGESLLISSTDRGTQPEGAAYAASTGARNAPYYSAFDATDPLGFNPSTAVTRGAGAAGNNLLWANDPASGGVNVVARKILGSAYGEFEPITGLKYRIALGVDYNVGDGSQFQQATTTDYGGGIRLSLLISERPIELTTNLTHTLTYQKEFGKHNITVLAGEEETNFSYDKTRLQGRDLFNTNIMFPSVAATVASSNEADHWALRGYLGRVFYSFDNRYLVTFNVRRDESSRFSSAHRSGTFPSVSAGWKLSEEKFFAKVNPKSLNDVKIRASWGQSGNQFTGQNFAYMPALQTTIFYVIGAGQSIVRAPAPVIFANENLKWETSTQLDFGADISMLNRKLDITFDYFKKTTNDVLLSLPIPYASGYFLPADANIGKINNTGFEFSANYKNKIGNLGYSLGGNITVIKNNVESLGDIKEIISGAGGAQTHRTTAGEGLGYFYGFKTDGIFQNAAEVAAALPDAFSSSRAPGDIRFVDVNGDKKIDANDRTKIGNSIPGYFYGMNASANYKGFDLGIFFQGVGDINIFNAVRASMEDMKGGSNQRTSVLSRWHGEGTSNTVPRATASDPNNNNRYSDRWIENGAYVRIKNLQIGYTVSQQKLKSFTKEFISAARFYIGIQNLATFTKYSGYDPEVTRGASFQKGEFPLANGVDPGSSPQPRVIQLGWQITLN
ncbi:MAG: TonB-dependent receptor [Ferruginibacter sp.]|nr:TonB-dependent receptor [Ferruginibacter sp.]